MSLLRIVVVGVLYAVCFASSVVADPRSEELSQTVMTFDDYEVMERSEADMERTYS